MADFFLIGDHLSGTEDLAPSTAAYEDDIHLVSEVIDPAALSRQALLNEAIHTPEAHKSFGLRPVVDVTEATLPPLDNTHSTASKVGSWLYDTTQFDVKQEKHRVTESEVVIGKARIIAPRIEPSISQPLSARKIVKGEKPTFPCEHCKRVFNNRSELRHHARRYEKRPYNCDFDGCNASFLYPKDLRRHRTTHTGSKVFRCPICPKSFSRKDNLRRHVQNEHGLPDAALSPNIEPMDTSGGRRNREPSEDSENGFENGNSPNNYSVPRADAAGPSGSNGRSGSGESPGNGAKVDNRATLAHSAGKLAAMNGSEFSQIHNQLGFNGFPLESIAIVPEIRLHGNNNTQQEPSHEDHVAGIQAGINSDSPLHGEVFRRMDELADHFMSLKADVHQSLQSMQQNERKQDQKLSELVSLAQSIQAHTKFHSQPRSMTMEEVPGPTQESLLPVYQNPTSLWLEPDHQFNITQPPGRVTIPSTEADSFFSEPISLKKKQHPLPRTVQTCYQNQNNWNQASQPVPCKRPARFDEIENQIASSKRPRYEDSSSQISRWQEESHQQTSRVEPINDLEDIQLRDRETPALTDGPSESVLPDFTVSGRTTPVPPDLGKFHSRAQGLAIQRSLPDNMWNLFGNFKSVW